MISLKITKVLSLKNNMFLKILFKNKEFYLVSHINKINLKSVSKKKITFL